MINNQTKPKMERQMTKKAYKDKEKRNDAKKLQTEMDLPKIPKISQSLIKALIQI
jgi:hypothetical protein